MNFRKPPSDEPEINLIPFIDVLLVVLIFLMLSTTYSRFTELQVTLPVANADAVKDRPSEILVAVTADGRYSVDRQPVDGQRPEVVAAALRQAAEGRTEPYIVVSADASSPHQSVINVLDAARRAGLARITFAAQVGGAPSGSP